MTSNAAAAVSCVECQRRKQKCNREFPCNHCLKRGVSHRCRFVSKTAALKSPKDERSQDGGQPRTSRKRSFDNSDIEDPSHGDPDHDDSGSDLDVSGALNGLGYLSHHHHLVLGQDAGSKVVGDIVEESDCEQSDELKAALALMPEKKYTDCLRDNFLNGANHQYCALYPPKFRTQYDGWWATPRNRVTPELTSLILRVCACSLHFIMEDSVRVRLEAELETDVLTFADRLHAAAEKLSTTIPPGKGGLVHVQQLFLTAFWFKSAEKWTEAWHALSKAIRAANEIGLHQDTLSDGMNEFDREMRRRVWVILYLWDFALGSMLSRPLLVNHADCIMEMPTLTLENNPQHPGRPSPFRHMNLHCQLCIDMATQLGGLSDSEADKAEVARRMRDAVTNWFDNLPAEYAVHDPETRWDKEFEWVVFQRRYLHLIGYMGLFSQLRPFIARSSAKPMSELESALRASGVDAALDLMDVSWRLFDNLVGIGAKFHYAIFCIFDAASVICSAFLQDEARNLPHREKVLEAVKKGLGMLAEAAPESKTTATLYRILRGLLTKLPLSVREQGLIGMPKRIKNGRTPPGDKAPTVKFASNPLAKAAPPEIRRASMPRHRSSSASSDSDATLDSQQPRSESSVSLPDSCRSTSAQAPSVAHVRRASVVPSNGVAAVDGLPSANGFMMSAPIHPAYPGTTESFMPATNAMATPVYMASDGFPPAPGFVQTTTFQYNSVLSPVDAVPFSEPGWQPSQVPINELGSNGNVYQPGSLAGFGSTAPEVLGYWDWQALGLGHPISWGAAQMQDQNGIRHHHAAVSGDFNGRVMPNDCGESSSTDDLGR